jgi:hypothetical protein
MSNSHNKVAIILPPSCKTSPWQSRRKNPDCLSQSLILAALAQGFVVFFMSYIILVVWIFFQVSVAVLLDNFLAARYFFVA